MQTIEEIKENKKLFNECINYFEQLIKEHFDNPPLNWEEVTKMVGCPIYFEKEWFLIWRTDYYKTNRKSISLINRTGNVVETVFEENNFYAREAK